MKDERLGVAEAEAASPSERAQARPGSPRQGLRRYARLRVLSDDFLAEGPTRPWRELDVSPLAVVVGHKALRSYEGALASLRTRDREACLARLELHWPYEQIAAALGVVAPRAARGVVIRALGRLVVKIWPMKHEMGRLESVVAAVADGWPQDWSALEERAGDGATRQGLKSLRVIDAIASFHRRSRSAGPSAGDPWKATGATEESATVGKEVLAEPARVVKQWGRFALREKLGHGGYGDVYCAYDPQLDRVVALKLLKPSRCSMDQADQLLDEARMLAQVRHPNVASVYGADRYDGQAGLWMELIRGATLEELIRSRGPMSASEAALVGQDVCRALTAVHRAGLVHRDVKTANVLREVGGRIVLTDFGAGRFRAAEPKRALAGTKHYVAPEVVAGSEATVLSDIYSLGVLLYRLVTSAYPRTCPGWETSPGEGRGGSPSSLRDLRSDLSPTFVAAVERALAYDPSERPPSAGALWALLGLVLGTHESWRKAGRVLRPSPRAS